MKEFFAHPHQSITLTNKPAIPTTLTKPRQPINNSVLLDAEMLLTSVLLDAMLMCYNGSEIIQVDTSEEIHVY